MFGIGKKKDEAAAPVEPSMASADVSLAPAAAVPAVEMHPAGFWLRVVAFIVDYAVLLILLAAMMMGAASVGGEDLLEPTYWLWILVSFFYWPVLESTAWRATVGKKMLGLVVGDIDGGGLNFVRSLLRNLAKIISSIPLGIGYLLAAFTARKQALHDLITKAVVMRKGPGSFVRAIGVLVLGIVLLAFGGYLSADYMMGSVMKEMEAMMGGGVAQQPPVKPAPQAAVKPPAPKPVAPAPSAPAPQQAATPQPAPAPSAAPAPQAQTPAPPPAAKPAPAPVQVAQAPTVSAKPAAQSAPTVPTATAAKPAAAPVAAVKPATSPAPKPEAAPPAAKPAPTPAPNPEPVKVAAAPKPEPAETKPAPAETKPAPPAAPRAQTEPVVPLARVSIPAQPGPRFNDVMTAVLYRDRATVSELVALGRWVDKRDSNGLTPLMLAASIGDAEMVRLLLQSGANPALQAPGGATALDFALEGGDAPTRQLLERKR